MCEKHLTAKGETWSYESTEYTEKSEGKLFSSHHSRITKPKMAEYLRFECSSTSGWTKIIRRWSNNARYFTSLSSGKKLQLEIVVLSKVIYCIWIFVNKVMPNNSSPWLDRVRALYKSCLAQFKPEEIVDKLACGGNNISQHLWSQRLSCLSRFSDRARNGKEFQNNMVFSFKT